eukprot:m.88914 g.88914  ORF g.88914 m.88914 type:complete len:443 (-) comp13197_c0_seq1:4861-6189(-)
MTSVKLNGKEVASDPKSIRQALTFLTRRLIDEEDEDELLQIFRATKQLKMLLEKIDDNQATAPKQSNLNRAKNTSATKRLKPKTAEEQARGMLTRSIFLPEAAQGAAFTGQEPIQEDILADGLIETMTDAGSDAPKEIGAGGDISAEQGEWEEEDDDEAEYFVCSQCEVEGKGYTDERDGNFYCVACWEEYQSVGKEDDGGEENNKEEPTDPTDPTHPTYWQNLKEGGTQEETDTDVFAKMSRKSNTEVQEEPTTALDTEMDAMIKRIHDKRKSIRYQSKKKKDKNDKKDGDSKHQKKFSKANKAKKKKMNPAELAKSPIELNPHGILVKNPVGALPIVKPELDKPKKRKKPAVPPPLFGVESNGSVLRDVYDYEPDSVTKRGYNERIGHANEDWNRSGLPVRKELAEFILDEFGGIDDTNTLHKRHTEEDVLDLPPPDYED